MVLRYVKFSRRLIFFSSFNLPIKSILGCCHIVRQDVLRREALQLDILYCLIIHNSFGDE